MQYFTRIYMLQCRDSTSAVNYDVVTCPYVFSYQDIDDDLDASLEDSEEDEYEGNKDAARSLLRVKQKLDGYEDGEMRSVHGQVTLSLHYFLLFFS